MASCRLRILPLVSCSAALAWALGAGRASAETVDVEYSISLIGLHIGEATAQATVDGDKYSVHMEGKMAGVASLVSSARSAATASGSILDGRVAPKAYATASVDSRHSRTVQMGMDAGSVRAVSIIPPMHDDPGRIPVTADLERGIEDPVSATVLPMPPKAEMIGPAACDRTIPVFDGYTQFDVKLTYAGSRPFAIKGYDGRVSVCAARYIPVAGHRPGTPGVVFMQNNKKLEVWLVPLGNARVEVPVRISIATQVGTTVVQATSFNVRSDEADGRDRPLDSKNGQSPSDASVARSRQGAILTSKNKE